MRATRVLLMMALGAGLALAQAPRGLNAGTKVDAKLQSKLNAKTAKVGDRVTAVTTAAVKEHGRTVLPKGTRLTGRVTSVAAAQGAESPSHIGILFDQATTAKGATMPVHLAVDSVMQAAMAAPMAPMPQPMPMPMPGAAAGGGLNIGGALAPTMGVAGGVAGGLGAATAMQPAAMPMPRLGAGAGTVTQSGGVLSVPQGNLMLHSGTRMKLIATGGGPGR